MRKKKKRKGLKFFDGKALSGARQLTDYGLEKRRNTHDVNAMRNSSMGLILLYRAY